MRTAIDRTTFASDTTKYSSLEYFDHVQKLRLLRILIKLVGNKTTFNIQAQQAVFLSLLVRPLIFEHDS